MLKYSIKRLLAGVLTMVVLITVAFFMMHAMPGGPFSPSEEKNVPVEVLERIAASYGLDQPVWKQYLNYWNNLLHGDLGVSYKTVISTTIVSTPASRRLMMYFSMISLPQGLFGLFYTFHCTPIRPINAMQNSHNCIFNTKHPVKPGQDSI